MKTDRQLLEELTSRLDRSNLTIRSDLNQFQDWYRKWRATEFKQTTLEETTPEETTGSQPSTGSAGEGSNLPASGASDESLHDHNTAEAENGADSESGQPDQATPNVDNSGS